MAVGNVTVQGNTSGGPTGSTTFGPLTVSAASAVPAVQTVSVGTNTTVTVPSGSTLAVLVGPNGVSPTPNPAYAGTLTIKGIAGDTGFAVSASAPVVLPLTGATFVVNASPATTVTVWSM